VENKNDETFQVSKALGYCSEGIKHPRKYLYFRRSTIGGVRGQRAKGC
jgi:hypothetical protein